MLITVTTAHEHTVATRLCDVELRTTPNMNGAMVTIEYGDFFCVDECDALVGTWLLYRTHGALDSAAGNTGA